MPSQIPGNSCWPLVKDKGLSYDHIERAWSQGIRPQPRHRRDRRTTPAFNGADPVARWCWPDSESYLTNMGRFANAYGGKAFRHGSAWTDSDFRGGALWLPPGEHPDEQELQGIVAATLEERKQGLLLAALEECGSYHPDEPHWFLPLIAVDPSCQGKGIGSRLMQHAVAQCDATGTRAYLESSNPRNIPLYERHGFRVVGEVRRGDCPVFTPMLRDPQ